MRETKRRDYCDYDFSKSTWKEQIEKKKKTKSSGREKDLTKNWWWNRPQVRVSTEWRKEKQGETHISPINIRVQLLHIPWRSSKGKYVLLQCATTLLQRPNQRIELGLVCGRRLANRNVFWMPFSKVIVCLIWYSLDLAILSYLIHHLTREDLWIRREVYKLLDDNDDDGDDGVNDDDNSEDGEHWQNNYWTSSFDPCVVVYLIQNLNYGN